MSTASHLPWRKSSYSGNGEGCVDVAPTSDAVFVRHTKHHDHGTITFTRAQWSTFLNHVRNGNSTADAGTPTITKDGADTILSGNDVALRFNDTEWTAFTAGVKDGEFDFNATR
ncbi:DUF397 domain-containing protein [Nocardia donostiensis]|uniref:DUF397 domain-containing protein n=1 Tax=Nocardia donostiensis TaxID=1538463 RepID=A0A1W0B9I5_9NOCA|nr:DUF397 domain-containing protein [Nocardia donostiensis]ONM49582.1 hypothetical protein B0T46_06975 [Nocardia donostiensis]OQS19203.1 hypothetical protein B0T44_15265 [Nocardia donostiensis]